MTKDSRTITLPDGFGHLDRSSFRVRVSRAPWEPEASGPIDRSETAPPNQIRSPRHRQHSIADTFTKTLRDELAAHRNTETRP